MVYQLAYFSAATVNFKEKELEQLLINARRNNEKEEVTGVLLFIDHCFLQVLEGDKETVMARYKKIEKDKRHEDVVQIYENETEDRSFGEWSMGFETLSAADYAEKAGFTDISNNDFIDRLLNEDGNKIMKILRSFYKFG